MKLFKDLIALALLAFTTTVHATLIPASSGYTQYATTGTAVGATNSYAVISSLALGGRTVSPTLTFLNATFKAGDATAGYIQFYTSTNMTSCVSNAATGGLFSTTTNTVNSTNGFTTNQAVVVRHNLTDTYEKAIIAALQNTNQIVFVTALATVPISGDTIWGEVQAGKIPAQGTNTSILGTGIYTGQAGVPMLIEVIGTQTNTLNAANAIYR